jgi:two-component system, OmpR family, clock-associated histidine kinase SasA
MQAPAEPLINPDVPLQILLFVDRRPNSRDQIRQIRSSLAELSHEYRFALQIIDVGEQPYLAEQFRLVATPALIKIHPEPRQTLAGSNLIAQLKTWWPRWQKSAEDYLSDPLQATKPDLDAPDDLDLLATQRSGISAIAYSAELIQLSDEIFRLKQEKEDLEAQLHFKDQIISMLAHDLRNPLTAASIAVETLEMGHNPKEGQPSRLNPGLTTQLLKHARTQIRTIDRMITDILQAARGTSTELNMQLQRLNLAALCQEVVVAFADRCKTKNQKVITDIPSDLPPVYADAERVRQVVINLLDNAVKYTPMNGTIQVSVLHRTTQKVQVSVCDDGPGIPTDNRDRIFEDHFRLQRDAAQDGYGIGLSLCQRIIRAHYGQIWVDSTPNQGSCFHFTLPVHRAQR